MNEDEIHNNDMIDEFSMAIDSAPAIVGLRPVSYKDIREAEFILRNAGSRRERIFSPQSFSYEYMQHFRNQEERDHAALSQVEAEALREIPILKAELSETKSLLSALQATSSYQAEAMMQLASTIDDLRNQIAGLSEPLEDID